MRSAKTGYLALFLFKCLKVSTIECPTCKRTTPTTKCWVLIISKLLFVPVPTRIKKVDQCERCGNLLGINEENIFLKQKHIVALELFIALWWFSLALINFIFLILPSDYVQFFIPISILIAPLYIIAMVVAVIHLFDLIFLVIIPNTIMLSLRPDFLVGSYIIVIVMGIICFYLAFTRRENLNGVEDSLEFTRRANATNSSLTIQISD